MRNYFVYFGLLMLQCALIGVQVERVVNGDGNAVTYGSIAALIALVSIIVRRLDE